MGHDRLLAIVGAGQFAQLCEDFVRDVGELFRAITGSKPVQHAIVTADIDHGGSGFVGAPEARVATAHAIGESRGPHERGVGADEVAKVADAHAVIVARALVSRAAAQVVQTCLPLSIRGEHSVILTSHRGPLYNQQERATSPCAERSHLWEQLRLSRSRRCVQENSGTRSATNSMTALTNGSMDCRSSSQSPSRP